MNDTVVAVPETIEFVGATKPVVVKVHELTIKQAAELRSRFTAKVRASWLARLREVSLAIPETAERARFLTEAARQDPDLSADTTKLVWGHEGFRMTLLAGSDMTEQQYNDVSDIVENADELLRAYKLILGIREEEIADPNVPQETPPG